jgi:hypothetical protein
LRENETEKRKKNLGIEGKNETEKRKKNIGIEGK